MDAEPEPPEAQAFFRAAERAGMATSLFETDRRLAGYDWYDGLDRVAGIAAHLATGGKAYPLEEFPLPERTGHSAAALPPRPETIRMDLAVRPVRGCCSARGLCADRRDKLLKWLDTAGSKLHAEQHMGNRLRDWTHDALAKTQGLWTELFEDSV